MKNIIKTISAAACLLCSFIASGQQPEFDLKANSPLVLRQGDHFEFTVSIMNNSDSEITGQVQLLLSDAQNKESVDGWFQNVFPNQFFTLGARDTESYKFPLEIPYQFTSSLHWQIIAATKLYRQEKSAVTPIVSNQFYRKESLHFSLKPITTEVFIKSLASSDKTPNLLQRTLSVEISSSRFWEACKQIALMTEVQNKPLDYFEKWAALSYAKYMINAFPQAQDLAKQNANAFPDQKNSLVAEISPWVFGSGNPLHSFSQIFDRGSNANALSNSMAFFEFAQNDDGSFPWFMGGLGDAAATGYISRTLQKMLTGGFVTPEHREFIKAMKAKADKWLNSKKRRVDYYNTQHDSLIAILKTGSKKPMPLPPIRWKAGDRQLNLNDTLKMGYAFQSVSGTLLNATLSKSVITTKDTARSLSGLITHDFFTDLPPGKTNQYLRLSKKIFIRTSSITTLVTNENTVFHPGDKIRVVLTVEALHPINFLMISDANPSAFYQKSSGMFVQRKDLNFYERQLPAGRKYFFPVLPIGKHEFTYETTVTQSGQFSAGMTTAESLATPGIFNFIKGFPVTIE